MCYNLNINNKLVRVDIYYFEYKLSEEYWVCDSGTSIGLKIDKDVLLNHILYYDWNVGNEYADEFKDGYHSKFRLKDNSNKYFYKKLIVNFEDIEEEFNDII